MKSLTNLLVFCLAVGLAWADVRYRGRAVHPDFPNQCYFQELQRVIPINELYTPVDYEGYCNRFYCRPDLALQIEHCSRHNLQPNATCSLYADIHQPFPYCCPKLVCQKRSKIICIYVS